MANGTSGDWLPIVVIGGVVILGVVWNGLRSHDEWLLSSGGKTFECAGGGYVKVDGHGEEIYCGPWYGEDGYRTSSSDIPDWCAEAHNQAAASDFLENNPDWGSLSEGEKSARLDALSRPPAEVPDFKAQLRDRAMLVPACSAEKDEKLITCLTLNEPEQRPPTVARCLGGTREWIIRRDDGTYFAVETAVGQFPILPD
jgi:hypothetical protein